MKKIFILTIITGAIFFLIGGTMISVYQILPKKRQNEIQKIVPIEKEIQVSQPLPYDPFGKKAVLGYLLRYPVFVDVLGAEIGLTEIQKTALQTIVKEEDRMVKNLIEAKLPPEEDVGELGTILKSTDERLKEILTPIQYIWFREWIVEEWLLDNYRLIKYYNLDEKTAKKANLTLPPKPKPIVKYWEDFLQNQLNLSSEKTKEIIGLIYQIKEDIFPLRKRIGELALDQTISLPKLQQEGEKIAQQIKDITQNLDKEILEKLPPAKKELYLLYNKKAEF